MSHCVMAGTPNSSGSDLMRIDKLFNQDQVWASERGLLPIEDMDIDHLQRLIPWMEKRAAGFADRYFLAASLGVAGAPDDVQSQLDAEIRAALADPVAWLHSTKLVRRLDAVVAEAFAAADEGL